MRCVVVAGARPQFVKAAALLPALRARGEALLVHTGQHTDPRMVEAHFQGLGLDSPDVHLEVYASDRPRRLAGMVQALAPVLEENRPDCVVVVGDTDSTVAAAMAASLAGMPLAHVEAGARSGERDLPEEVNRILVDELSDLLFAATPASAANLEGREGVHMVGDVMADVLLGCRESIEYRKPQDRGDYGVLTLHRAATADDDVAVGRVLSAATSAGSSIVFPRHPRTRLARIPDGIEICEPLPYLDFLGLVAGAQFVLTDSGGLQKEAYLLGVPCITLREATEWTETVEAGWNVLVGTDAGRIETALRRPPSSAQRPELYGDGAAARRIAERLGS
ncbi:MAG: non-hydrolyzing UDP-N-acetylglucosamine 2-epimerase [Planctomycetota bacterium]|jgi:UDP-N-acetylglucosamine 2-epimerase